MNTEVNKLLANPEVRAAILAQGAEPQALSAAQFGTLLKNDHAKWKGIVAASEPAAGCVFAYSFCISERTRPKQHKPQEKSGYPDIGIQKT